MCGIAGIFAYRAEASPVDGEALLRMREHMVRRGPDGAGLWFSCDRSVGLAHRRLSIIDLSEMGAQPMVDPTTGNAVVFNGEIYNYRELRRELEQEGAAFRSQSDTEVLLHLYARRGKAMVEQLRGMFAFALWDDRERRLFLARDPMGIKPLYYVDDGRTISFASQVKALIAGGAVSTPSAAGMTSFLLFGHVLDPWTWVEGIKALPAGTSLTIECGRPLSAPYRYFDLRQEILAAEADSSASTDALQEALAGVDESVRQHLVADVPVGLFLSAGRDSTLLGTLAARHLGRSLQTITLGFEEFRGTALDETPVAEAVAQRLGSRHETKYMAGKTFLCEMERILSAMDQPSIDGVNTWFVSRAAAQAGMKVALSGLGGDELFGGYPSFRQVPRLAHRLGMLAGLASIGRGLRLVSAPMVGRLASPKWASLFEYGATLEGAWLLRRAVFMPWEITRVVDPDLAHRGLQELAPLETLRASITGIRNPRLAVMALEIGGYMRNQLLRDADWAGMAHSLEIRVPLVDVVLLRRWLRVAARRFPLDRQQLLEAVDPSVAALIGARPKSGFSVPVAQWLTESSVLAKSEHGLRPWARFIAERFSDMPARIRIAALLTDAYGSNGGIAKFNRDLLQALARMPEVKAVFALPRLVQREPELVPRKVRFDSPAARGKWSYVLRAVRLALARQGFNLVICGHINLLPVAWLVSRAQACPLLLIVHGVEAWQPHRNPLVRFLLPRADGVVAVSRYTAERMCGWCGLPEQRFRILPNCVDLETFVSRPPNSLLSQRYGLDGSRVLLTVGRLESRERYKGCDEMLEILPQLGRELTDIVYVVVGDGNDRARLQAKAEALGVADRVVFTGFVSEEDKIDLFNLADVFVMPSRGEGFGIVHLEAMACGVPTIGSKLDGSRDALRDGALGQLVDPRDPQQLVQAIRCALATPRGRPAGIEYFSQQFYEERVAALVREFVKKPA
ncbi:MAG TPA: asparagine synthase (glutamine-hydrolyzing) [Bryobacteraceae bacterium]|nr:asparagine synthase (glutamine-hydrolyzing) [Bryobacteraceae bacterium]